nr:hypothetical chloroplast RF15 [Aconitum episcopale]YP_009499989.1 hypothetical chloroplast RF15 [Aconitum episcopale]AXC46910.1 hypothetical chloroplast RF15 [Aconitum episcopale]AXC46927.1 hypothetical chloroplast RF15 [Aconitum episcopale]
MVVRRSRILERRTTRAYYSLHQKISINETCKSIGK